MLALRHVRQLPLRPPHITVTRQQVFGLTSAAPHKKDEQRGSMLHSMWPSSVRGAGLSTTQVTTSRIDESSTFASTRVPPSLLSVRDQALQVWEQVDALSQRASSVYNRFAATPYGRLLRLDKPTGAQLLFLPCAWGIGLGATSVFDVVGLSALLYGGAVVVRGAGCTVNDIFDADVDKQVERTKNRPLAAGEVSTPAAVALATGGFTAGLGVLTCLTPTAFMLGTMTLIPALYYPISKRVFRYPQAILATTFNVGALIGYASCTNSLALPALAAYASGICWTMVYDTIYAHQDKRDDAKVGIGSTALAFKGDTKNTLALFGIGQYAALLAAGATAGLGTTFYMGAAIAASRTYQQIYETDLDQPEQCAKAFNDNAKTGALVWASILAGRLL